MAIATQRTPPRMTLDLFRAFYASRPDEERWELIDGVAMMMTPATPRHQRIASNLEQLLNDAIEAQSLPFAAYQRLGVNIAPSVEFYDPEPDVIVVDAELRDDQRYMDRFYLAAEIVSTSDRTWVDKKRDIYKMHEHCTCVLTVQQDRFEVRIELRTSGGWDEQRLTNPTDTLVLSKFGLRCRVADLYRGTPLQPRRQTAH